MNHPDYNALIKQITSTDHNTHLAAKMILLAMQEDAIDPLADMFYAGVNDVEGQAIIDIMATIGGYNAILVLKQIFEYHQYSLFVKAAATGLLKNSENLAQTERETVAQYLLDND